MGERRAGVYFGISWKQPNPRVDLVVPVYNEEEGILAFHQQLARRSMRFPTGLPSIMSTTAPPISTAERLSKYCSDERVSVMELSRNFGHQAALTAGLDTPRAIMSYHGRRRQHPPAMIAEMLRTGRAGYDIVLTQRSDETGGSSSNGRPQPVLQADQPHRENTDAAGCG